MRGLERAANTASGEYAASTGRTHSRTSRAHAATSSWSAPGNRTRLAVASVREPPVYTGLGDMQPDIDAQLSNFFVENSVPEFSRVMRGYDPAQVNAHLEGVHADVRKHQENAQALQRELTEAHRQLQEMEQPTYSGVGKRVEQLLRLAEEQAKMRTTAEREVAQMRASSKRDRDEILTTAKRQADEMRSQAQRAFEDSEAARAQQEAEHEMNLAARREEAERQETERLAKAQEATQKMVSEAEQRAAVAEDRASKASLQA